METTTQPQNPATEKKEWANLSDDEEEEVQQQDTKNKETKPKKKKTTTSKPGETKKSNNIFQGLGDEEDEDEPEQPAKKEGQSFKDFIAKPKVEKKEEAKPALSKKEQKQKELDEFDQILAEFKGNQPEAQPVAEAETTKDVKQAEKPAGAEGEKKKKKKKEKKEGETKEVENKEEAKESTEPGQTIDVEKRIQDIIKAKAAKAGQQKKSGLNLEAAKQEIAARQQKKTKKKYEDL